ncbi:unnamed protein product [Cylindrotheca closterium]|uniref:Uncharacterized protein n=1 Tax=Cylindrotheca closterium TaxID=2856 RepID=A0AAD2PWU6_9STRA|nr:unnamed protein product [Cylindrotheca closterium]
MKPDAVEIAAHFENKSDDDLTTITFTRDHSWLDAMQMLQDLQESNVLLGKCKRTIHWCIWPNAPMIEEVAALMIETLEYFASSNLIEGDGVRWERFVFQDMDQSNENHCRILFTVCRIELFECLWIGGRNDDQDMTGPMAMDLSHAISLNSSMVEICVFLKLTDECFPILGRSLEKAKNQKKLSLHLNLSDSVYSCCSGDGGSSSSSTLAFEEFHNGLALNKSLRQLDLDGLPAQWLPLVFQALRNSSVEELSLRKCQWEEEVEVPQESSSPVWDHLARYLSSNDCKLKTLDLSYPFANLNVTRLAACMDRNTSLETLRLKHAGLVASECIELLATSANNELFELDLQSNSISLLDFSNLVMLDGFTATLQNTTTTTTTSTAATRNRLSRLNLDGNRNNHIWPKEDAKKIQTLLLWLLKQNPFLIFLGDRFARSYLCGPLVQHDMDLNRVGQGQWWRAVIIMSSSSSSSSSDNNDNDNDGNDNNNDKNDDSSLLHLALWPYMLARVSSSMRSIEPKRQASVIFRLVVDGVGNGMLALL